MRRGGGGGNVTPSNFSNVIIRTKLGRNSGKIRVEFGQRFGRDLFLPVLVKIMYPYPVSGKEEQNGFVIQAKRARPVCAPPPPPKKKIYIIYIYMSHIRLCNHVTHDIQSLRIFLILLKMRNEFIGYCCISLNNNQLQTLKR